MSVEQAKAFVEKMKADEAFRAKVMAVEDADARMALSAAEGFDCTAEEIHSLQELRELDLNGVAGGGSVSGSVPDFDYGCRCQVVYPE
jgi:predicted ribosomally synthesized peptide with nif11-like leader